MKLEMDLPQAMIDQLHQEMFLTAKQAFKEAACVQSFGEYLTKKDAAKYLHVSDATLNTFIKEGLRVATVGNIQRLSKKECDRFMQEYQI